MKIDRTLFWFKDGDEALLPLNERFFAYGTLLNRLLNETYNGKKIKFINIDFSTEETYVLHKNLPKNSAYAYNGHLRYFGVINLENFAELDEYEQKYFLWDKAYKYLNILSDETKNKDLKAAVEHAYKSGLANKLNPDFRVVVSEIVIHGVRLIASIWINFERDEMYSKLTLSKDNEIIFEKNIDKTKNGVEFFLEMYKAIEVQGDSIVIKGHKDVDYLPLYVPIEKEIIK